MEKGDTDHHYTALRELTEETGISISPSIVNGPRRLNIHFSEKEGTSKEVFWYLAETDELEVSLS